MRCNVLLITAVALSIACARPWPSDVAATVTTTGFDFTKYSDKGFLFTPNTYSGAYESRGLITTIVLPGATVEKVEVLRKRRKGKRREEEEWTEIQPVWKVEPLSLGDVFDEVYAKCVEMGADALTEMKVKAHKAIHGRGTMKRVRLNGYKVTGFAIKRRGAEQ